MTNEFGLSALLVEDETLVAWHLEGLLYELGMKTCEIVTTGRGAIGRAMQSMPDVIFMDVNLTGEFDGIETAKQIVAQSKIPIVFVTAYADDPSTVGRIRASLGDAIILGKPATHSGVKGALRLLAEKGMLAKSD